MLRTSRVSRPSRSKRVTTSSSPGRMSLPSAAAAQNLPCYIPAARLKSNKQIVQLENRIEDALRFCCCSARVAAYSTPWSAAALGRTHRICSRNNRIESILCHRHNRQNTGRQKTRRLPRLRCHGTSCRRTCPARSSNSRIKSLNNWSRLRSQNKVVVSANPPSAMHPLQTSTSARQRQYP
jgi:hypothetical protein